MRRLHSIRWANIPLLLLPLTACSSWQASAVTPQELFATKAPAQIRITTTDARTITLQQPHLVGDTLSGKTGRDVKGYATGDITGVAVRKFSGGKTAGLALGMTLSVAAMVAVGNALDDYVTDVVVHSGGDGGGGW